MCIPLHTGRSSSASLKYKVQGQLTATANFLKIGRTQYKSFLWKPAAGVHEYTQVYREHGEERFSQQSLLCSPGPPDRDGDSPPLCEPEWIAISAIAFVHVPYNTPKTAKVKDARLADQGSAPVPWRCKNWGPDFYTALQTSVNSKNRNQKNLETRLAR